MRKFSVAATAAALALALVGCASQSQETPHSVNASADETESSQNELQSDNQEVEQASEELDAKVVLGNLSFKYPSSWPVSVNTDDHFQVVSPTGAVTAAIQSVQFSTVPLDDDLVSCAYGAASAGKPGGAPSNYQKSKIWGFEGARFQCDLDLDGRTYATDHTLLICNKTIYDFTIGYSDDAYEDVANSIYESLWVTKNSSPAVETAASTDEKNDDSSGKPNSSDSANTSDSSRPSSSSGSSHSPDPSSSPESSSSIFELAPEEFNERMTGHLDDLHEAMDDAIAAIQAGKKTTIAQANKDAETAYSSILALKDKVPSGYEKVWEHHAGCAHDIKWGIGYLETAASLSSDADLFNYYMNLAADSFETAAAELAKGTEALESINENLRKSK
ncbi:hypothetical protein [Adlercreutzia aquisgranensis]|uniref:hypothetical protein n=1 Tax=Adlercreutzia aquisgranensis TaxID=2941323 RepID=UPI0020426219|nr:hypothetical protein [Adlercreutzia aquisgranensis]